MTRPIDRRDPAEGDREHGPSASADEAERERVDGGGPAEVRGGAGRPLSRRGLAWVAAGGVVAVSWAASLAAPLALLIVPALLTGIVLCLRGRAWFALAGLIVLNPLGVYFIGGVADYCGGAPSLQFYGLPSAEAFNLDRDSRGFPRGGGCLVNGDEWVYCLPHNEAVRLMSRLFGPPWRSYDGPYPTREQAAAAVADASPTPLPTFLAGRLEVAGQTVDLPQKLAERIVDELRMAGPAAPELPGVETTIRAATFEDRCLVLRLTERWTRGPAAEEPGIDALILIDRTRGRPFAWYDLSGAGGPRFSAGGYLTEW